MMDEIDTIKRLINTLEERIKELETENRALKSAILNACDTLTRQNLKDRHAWTSVLSTGSSKTGFSR